MSARLVILRFIRLAVAATIAVGALSTTPARAASLVVNTNADNTTAADTFCTLREALGNANANTDATSGDCAAGDGADTITFDGSLSGLTIMLTADLPAIADQATIDGSSLASQIVIDGVDSFRPFFVDPGVALTLTALAISHGSGSSGGSLYNNGGTVTLNGSIISSSTAADSGGAVLNTGGTLTVSSSYFAGNTADQDGGGIYNDGGTLVVDNSAFSDNDSSAGSGGALANNSGNATVSNSTFTTNIAALGGAISNGGTLSVSNSTFTGNLADSGGGINLSTGTATVSSSTFVNNGAGDAGGGIQNSGDLTVTNSTFYRNAATDEGGGISNYGTLGLTNSTFSANKADAARGGGIYNHTGFTLNYANTIVANSSGGGDCFNSGTIGTNTRNLVESNSPAPNGCGVPYQTSDPNLGPLADNGGPTQTMRLNGGSPAIDAGSNAVCAAAPVNNIDQRGAARPQDGNNDGTVGCDIGAYEVPGPTQITITADAPDPSTQGQSVPVSVTVSGGSTTPTGGVDITGADTNCSMTLSGGSGSCNVVFTNTGSRTLTATYNGDLEHSTSSDTEPHDVWAFMIFRSVGSNDGWVLESTETSGIGGSKNDTASTLRVGDDASDRQYRSLLSFSTSGLPDGATIKKVVVYVRQQSVSGENPVNTHNKLYVDIRKGIFGSGPTLELGDFQASASLLAACTIGTVPTNAWYHGTCLSSAFSYINKTGATQMRLRFSKDDNDDRSADILNLFSGNAATTNNRPFIKVFYLP